MATLFQSFRSSSMPKRLLRYALAKLELLDAEALDMENLDFAIGKNTVFEFRDVGIQPKKLEKLLKLPEALRLHKAKVIVLRVTIPVDFYSSPITIDVDGVDVKLQVLADRSSTPGHKTPGHPKIVPDTVDLAQSFLDAQPLSEKRQLEEALAAETQDLGASVTISDDGSNDEESFGTGQPLSLPTFLADFLQGIVDRTQVKIRGVTFQLDIDVPVDPTSSHPDPVSFQLALEDINIEGVTTQAEDNKEAPTIVHKEGKRHVSLNNVRAYLISEANVFSALAQSPSTMSPSLASSPAMTRNPPSRESTASGRDNLHQSLSGSIRQQSPLHLSSERANSPEGDVLTDSEEALEIPYDMSDPEEPPEEEGPATPRASVYHGFDASPEQSMFHSTVLPSQSVASSTALEADIPLWQSAHSDSQAVPGYTDEFESTSDQNHASEQDSLARSTASSNASSEGVADDLTQSHMYTHEEAESMYMSAFSNSAPEPATGLAASGVQPAQPEAVLEERNDEKQEEEPPQRPIAPEPTPSAMPGGWADEPESPTQTSSSLLPGSDQGSQALGADAHSEKPPSSLIPESDPQPTDDLNDPEVQQRPSDQEDIATPKGPARLVKEFLSVKAISLYLPSQHQHIHVHAASAESVANLAQSMGASTYPQAPGAFSVHGIPRPSPEESRPAADTSQDELDDTLEVDLSPISIQFDASLGFLLAMVVGRLMSALRPEGASTTEQSSAPTASESSTPRGMKVTAQELSVDFVNHLVGVADTFERHLDPNAFNIDKEVLLNTTLQNMTITTCHTEGKNTAASMKNPSKSSTSSSTTKIELERFRFGYADDDIVSFDKARPMSTSIRDTFLSAGQDVGVKLVNTGGHTRTDIETLPLVVQIDLQRLDETFGWFGGLSSFLNMSTSMASVHSPILTQSHIQPKKSPRVRFDAPLNPDNKASAAESKINLRIGGSWIELRGRECSFSAESSAVKVISREEGVGIAVSFLRLSGPHLKNSLSDPAITTEISGVRLDFLTMPKDADLERLLELITPSKVKFDQGDDDIMVDTLLRQRRKGSVLRVNMESATVRVKNMNQLVVLPNLGAEIAKLAAVAKYLPEDDRPGLLTLGRIQKFTATLDCGGQLGLFDASLNSLEIGHITVPSLTALSVNGISLLRNGAEELIGSAASHSRDSPVFMARMIGDEIEPVIKLKLQNVVVEYRVPFVMDILGLGDDATPQDFEAGLAASVANLGDQAQATLRRPKQHNEKSPAAKPMTLDVGFSDCLLGLNPLQLSSKLVVALTDAHLEVLLPQESKTKAVFNVNKSSVLLIDDVSLISPDDTSPKAHRRSSSTASKQVTSLCAQGFVDICYISSAKVIVDVSPGVDDEQQVIVDVRDDLLVLETCADSTQTLITLANALKPPTPPSKENKYRTNVMPVEDLLASISAEAFGRPEGEYDFDQDFAGAQELVGSSSDVSYGSGGSPLQVDSRHYGEDQMEGEELFDAMKSSGMSQGTSMRDVDEGVLLSGLKAASTAGSGGSSDDLVIHDDFYASNSSANVHHTARVWNSAQCSYDRAPEKLVKRSPLKVTVRDTHLIWNLFDGYDWTHTRDVITKAVQEVESKAVERQSRGEGANVYEEEIEDEETIGDFLFNSIYIGIPANRDPGELARAINEELNDNATETESVATTAFTGTTNRTARPHRPKSRRLRLNRSRHHKITFELQGVNVDMFTYPGDLSKTESSIDVRVNNLDIFDHVPSSTWKKFATYDQDAGEREMGASMVHLEILNVKPLLDLPISEIVLRASVLPLRLHVDQDALDFITRFFEFKDEKVPVHSSPSDVPFIQRAEVQSIPVKLDFKPKRVDYAGLRSGHTSEFMNFIVLEESRMVLRHAIIYGTSGFDRLGKTLNDLWTPDVTNNQLPGVIAGLAPVRSLVNIGSGFKDLVEIPIKEYQKDGRVIRSISKGAAAFARTTGTEIVKLGAKLAVGTQYALQGAEEMLTEQQTPQVEGNWDEDEFDAEEKKQVSLYADPPPSVMQGLRGGYRSLARDVNTARDAIIAVPGEVMQSQSPGGAARAVWKRAPTIVFRPAMGVTKVIGQTLMGATNTMDPQHRRRVDEKYKH